MKDDKVYVRMLGNVGEMEVGKTYAVGIAKANELAGIGFAVIVDAPVVADKGE